MKYILKIDALGNFPEIEIDKKRYESICRSKEALSNALAMEEKYEILISNYLEFEEEMLRYAARSMIRRPYDYEDFFQVRLGFNIKLVNLLTAARLYKDQLHRHVRAIKPDIPTIKEDIEKLFSGEYDQNSEYRFIEELRNYVQHKGVPVHWIQGNAFSDDSGEERLLIFSMELASQKEHLSEDKKFKKWILDEIPEKVDLKNATRVYIESTSKVHCSARKIVEQALKESREIIERARSEYKKVYQDNFVGLSAICLDKDKIVEKKPLLLDWDDIRLKLTRRNSELINLRNRYVTGRTKIS